PGLRTMRAHNAGLRHSTEKGNAFHPIREAAGARRAAGLRRGRGLRGDRRTRRGDYARRSAATPVRAAAVHACALDRQSTSRELDTARAETLAGVSVQHARADSATGLQEVIAELRDAFDDDDIAQWFARPNSRLRGLSPARLISIDPAPVL